MGDPRMNKSLLEQFIKRFWQDLPTIPFSGAKLFVTLCVCGQMEKALKERK